MDSLLAWLLAEDSPPWVCYRVRRDLLGQGDDDPQVQDERRALLADPQVQGLLAELAGWPGKVVSSHKSAGQPFHKLTFAADLGLRADDPGVGDIIERILAHPSAQGPFSLPMTIAPAYGGSGQEQWAWALCDAPLILYALLKFGLGEDARVQAAVAHLAGLVRDNGWPCAVSPELGSWRGPGRKEDPCPFANLAMLKALAQAPEWRDSPGCSRRGRDAAGALGREPRAPPVHLLHGHRLPQAEGPLRLVRSPARAGCPDPVSRGCTTIPGCGRWPASWRARRTPKTASRWSQSGRRGAPGSSGRSGRPRAG